MSRTSLQPTSALARRNTTRRRINNPGVMRLRLVADLKVAEKSLEIANALVTESLTGNASSARLLVELAEGAEWINDPEAVERVLTIAAEWKKEQQWNGKLPVLPLEPDGPIGTKLLLTDGKPQRK